MNEKWYEFEVEMLNGDTHIVTVKAYNTQSAWVLLPISAVFSPSGYIKIDNVATVGMIR